MSPLRNAFTFESLEDRGAMAGDMALSADMPTEYYATLLKNCADVGRADPPLAAENGAGNVLGSDIVHDVTSTSLGRGTESGMYANDTVLQTQKFGRVKVSIEGGGLVEVEGESVMPAQHHDATMTCTFLDGTPVLDTIDVVHRDYHAKANVTLTYADGSRRTTHISPEYRGTTRISVNGRLDSIQIDPEPVHTTWTRFAIGEMTYHETREEAIFDASGFDTVQESLFGNIRSQREQLSTTNAELQRLTADMEALETQLHAIERQQTSLQGRRESAIATLASADDAIASLTAEHDDAVTRREELMRYRDTLAQSINQAVIEREGAEHERENLQAAVITRLSARDAAATKYRAALEKTAQAAVQLKPVADGLTSALTNLGIAIVPSESLPSGLSPDAQRVLNAYTTYIQANNAAVPGIEAVRWPAFVSLFSLFNYAVAYQQQGQALAEHQQANAALQSVQYDVITVTARAEELADREDELNWQDNDAASQIYAINGRLSGLASAIAEKTSIRDNAQILLQQIGISLSEHTSSAAAVRTQLTSVQSHIAVTNGEIASLDAGLASIDPQTLTLWETEIIDAYVRSVDWAVHKPIASNMPSISAGNPTEGAVAFERMNADITSDLVSMARFLQEGYELLDLIDDPEEAFAIQAAMQSIRARIDEYSRLVGTMSRTSASAMVSLARLGGDQLAQVLAVSDRTTLVELNDILSHLSSYGSDPDFMRATSQVSIDIGIGDIRIFNAQGKSNTFAPLNIDESSLHSEAAVTMIDFADVSEFVRSVRFHIASLSPTDSVHITFLRGSEHIGSMTVVGEKDVSFSDDNGITGVIIQHVVEIPEGIVKDFLAYAQSADAKWWWNEDFQWGRHTANFGFGETGPLRFFANSSLTAEQKQDIMRRASQGNMAHSVAFSDLQIDTLSGVSQQLVDPLTMHSTTEVAVLTAPDWRESKDPLGDAWKYHWSNVALQQNMSGEAGSGIGLYVHRAANKYTLLTLTTTGSGEITELWYARADGLRRVPSEYIRRNGPRSVMILPGGPQEIFVTVTGSYSLTSRDFDFADAQEHMPRGGLHLEFGASPLRIGQSPSSINSGSYNALDVDLYPGSHLRAWVSAMNAGTATMTADVDVYIGYGTQRASQLGTYELLFEPQKATEFLIEGGIPSTDADDQPIMTFVIRPRGGGTEQVYTMGLRRTDLVGRGSTSEEDAAQKIARIQSRIQVAANAGGDSRLIAWYGENGPSTLTLANTSLPQNIPLPALTPQELDVIAEMSKEDMRDLTRRYYQYGVNLPLLLAQAQQVGRGNFDADGTIYPDIGGSTGNFYTLGQTQKDMYQAVMTLHKRNLHVMEMNNVFYVSDATSAGRIVMGILENAPTMTSSERRTLAAQVEAITGIDAGDLYGIMRDNGEDGKRFERGLIELFTNAGYGHIFKGTIFALIDPTQPAMRAEVLGGVYHPGEDIEIEWDINTGGKKISHGFVYLIDVLTDTQMPDAVASINADRLTVNIPSENVKFWRDKGPLKAKVVVWFEGDQNERVFDITDDSFNLTDLPDPDPSVEQLSVSGNPDEDVALSAMNFPVKPGNWSYGMGSGWHDGEGLYALDLNVENDENKPVSAAYSGKVLAVNLDTGMVKIQHTLKNMTWTTSYLHMTHILEDKINMQYFGIYESRNFDQSTKNLAAEQRLAAQSAIDAWVQTDGKIGFDEQIGLVGSEGESTGPHLHFQANNADGTPINLFHWADAEQPRFNVIANVGGKNDVVFTWNDQVQALTNDSDGIAMIRADAPNGGRNIAHALTADFSSRNPQSWQEVKYVVVSDVRKSDGTIGDMFLWVKSGEIGSPNVYWNSFSFVSIPH